MAPEKQERVHETTGNTGEEQLIGTRVPLAPAILFGSIKAYLESIGGYFSARLLIPLGLGRVVKPLLEPHALFSARCLLAFPLTDGHGSVLARAGHNTKKLIEYFIHNSP